MSSLLLAVHMLLSLATSLVLSRLDFGGSTLADLPRHLLDRLQSVLNAAARLIFSARKFASDFPFRLLVDAVTHVFSVFRVCKVP